MSICLLALAACGKSQHTVAYDGTRLSVDVQPVRVSAARFHYWQWPSPDSWPSAFHELRSRGFNTVALDLFWGYHSARAGSYDFTGIRDLDKLLDDAAREHLFVAVDAGPYIDGGADASGLPDWLLAHTASPATIRARYLREARTWISRVDAIVRRHQLTAGDGNVVLYHIDAGALAKSQEFESAARRDGITVPFGKLPAATTLPGFAWGWTTAPRARDSVASRDLPVADATASPIAQWRTRRDDRELSLTFEDQAWPPLLTARQFDADDNDDDEAPVKHDDDDKGSTAIPFFGVDDYGFHHGTVWYRGHFVASGSERSLQLSGMTGVSGACTVWLNGTFLGSLVGDANGAVSGTLAIPNDALRTGGGNLVSVAFENTGHDADPHRDIWRVQPRGMFSASLKPATAVAWHVLGNGEYNVDPVRGPLNSGGLAGEIAGWQDPSFPDAGWTRTQLPLQASRPGIVWYRAHMPLSQSLADDRILTLRLGFSRGSRYRAFVFCNGWMVAHLANDGANTHVIPVPPGLVKTTGDNTLAIVVWTLAGTSALDDVALTTVPKFGSTPK